MRFSLLVILANGPTRRPISISLKRNVGLKNKIGSALGMHGRSSKPRRCEQISRTSPAISDHPAKRCQKSLRNQTISQNFHAYVICLLRSAALIWCMIQTHSSKCTKKHTMVTLLISAVLCASAYATPKAVIISLDGATPRIIDQLNAGGQLNPNEGVNVVASWKAFGVSRCDRTVRNGETKIQGQCQIA